MTITMPVVVTVSQATRPLGSWAIMASSTASEIWSQTLSGCPSVTDSEVKIRFAMIVFSFLRFCVIGSCRAAKHEKNTPGGVLRRVCFPHLALTAGIGTLRMQVAVASSGRSLRHS